MTRTVSGSTTSTAAMLASTNWNSSDVRPGYWPRYASRLFFTTSAVSGDPSWNVMPGRSAIVHSVKSEFGVTASARNGTNSPSPLGTVRVS